MDDNPNSEQSAASGLDATDKLPEVVAGLNVAAALKLVAGKEKIFRRLIEVFRESYLSQEYNVRECFEAGNIEEAGRVAHSLKGIGGSLGAERLRAVAVLLDEKFKAGDVEAVAQNLQEYDDAIAEVIGSIETLLKLGS